MRSGNSHAGVLLKEHEPWKLDPGVQEHAAGRCHQQKPNHGQIQVSRRLVDHGFRDESGRKRECGNG
jgi:hypothetical protein